MLVCMLLVVLVLALAFYQSTQGMFSALLMAGLTLCCAGAAYGTYEWVAIHWIAPYWGADYSASIALCAIFGLPLLGLRFAADRLIRRSPLLPLMIDRAGAALCGIVTGMVTGGVFAQALMGIPFGPSLMGFARLDIPAKEQKEDAPTPVPPNPDDRIRELWFAPDRFAAGVAKMLSGGVFSGPLSFQKEHPDLIEAGAWLGAVPAEVSRFAPPGSISVVRTEPVQFVFREVPGPGGRRGEDLATFEPILPKSGHQYRMVRVQLKKEALDKNKSHTFSLRQFRIVGQSNPKGSTEQYHPIALQQNKTEGTPLTVNRHIRVVKTRWGDWPVTDNLYGPRGDNSGQVEIVFELPAEFSPSYLEYKRGARAAVKFDQTPAAPTPSEPEKEAAAPATTPPEGAVPPVAQGGNVRRYTTKQGASFFGEDLPMPLRAFQKLKNAEIERGAMAAGHLVGYVDEQDAGKEQPVAKFQVDKEKRLLHLNTGYLKAKSTLGKAISFAVETVQNFTVEDSDGNQYVVAGKYAIADVDGRQVIEVQYFSERAGTIGQLGPFSKIKDTHLKGDYEYVLLFLVNRGSHIVAFSTGGSSNRRDDLSAENLIAPE